MPTRTLWYVVVVLAVLASLAGCAASPGIVSPPDADRQAKLFLSSADTAAIYVYSDSDWAGLPLMLVRNGRIATWTWPGYFVLFEVPPGPHVFLSLGGANVASLTINAEPGGMYYVSQEPTSGWGRLVPRTELYQVDAERGRDQVLKSKRLRAND